MSKFIDYPCTHTSPLPKLDPFVLREQPGARVRECALIVAPPDHDSGLDIPCALGLLYTVESPSVTHEDIEQQAVLRAVLGLVHRLQFVDPPNDPIGAIEVNTGNGNLIDSRPYRRLSQALIQPHHDLGTDLTPTQPPHRSVQETDSARAGARDIVGAHDGYVTDNLQSKHPTS